MKKLKIPFIISVCFLCTSCALYKVGTVKPQYNNETLYKMLYDNEFVIVHFNNEHKYLNLADTSGNTILGILSNIPDEHLTFFYNSDQKKVVRYKKGIVRPHNEVHLYLNGYTSLKHDKLEFTTLDVAQIHIYKEDHGINVVAAQYLPIILLGLAVAGLSGIAITPGF